MSFDEFLLAGRALAHLATFLIIARFCDPSARYRPFVSLFAVVLAGSSLALAVQILTNWPAVRAQGPHIWATIYAATVFGAVAYTGGNLARLLPRIKWSRPA